MKITILPVEKKEEPLDKVTLYNLVKRCQEDLLASCPVLDEFVLEIKIHPTFIKYNSVPCGTHDLLGDKLTLKIASYPQQPPEKVYQHVSERLFRIKRTLSY